MPDHFDAKERASIRERLIYHADRLFRTKGVKATKIAELAAATGISKGSFYAFFPSKEALLADLLDSIEKSEREGILIRLAALSEPKAEDIGELLLDALNRAVEHPLLSAIFKDPEFNTIFRTIPADSKDHLIAADVAFAAQVIEVLADKGVKTSLDPAVVAGMFRSLFLALSAPEEIGRGVHSEVVDRLAAAIAVAIFKSEGDEKEGL